MLNWDRIGELRDEIGEEDYSEIVELFFEEVETAIARLSHPGTPPERESDLHFLKGSALNLGFRKLGELCTTAEEHAAGGEIGDDEVHAVIECYYTSRDIFQARKIKPS